MSRELRLAAAFGLLMFAGSFLLPAVKPAITNLPGYQAAWNIFTLPFRGMPEPLWRKLVLVLIWPTNLLVLTGYVRLLAGKPAWTRWLAIYGLVGQFYWFFDPDISTREFGVGYWVWVFSGIVLVVIAVMAGNRVSPPAPAQPA